MHRTFARGAGEKNFSDARKKHGLSIGESGTMTDRRCRIMLQQVMTEPGRIIFREIPRPEPMAGEVRIKIMNIGICGSDIHVYHGKHPFTKYPVTQGHEVSGLIDQIGEGVTGFTLGQKVTIQPQVVCGECWPCRHGKYNLCRN